MQRDKNKGKNTTAVSFILHYTTFSCRAQEFRDKVTQHKEPGMPLNSHKYSFVHPEQTEKWYRCACKVAVSIKQAGDRCMALKS